MRKPSHEKAAAGIMLGAVTAAALGSTVLPKVLRDNQTVEGHALPAPSTSTHHEAPKQAGNAAQEISYHTMVLAQGIHELSYMAPSATAEPGNAREGINIKANFTHDNGVTTYFEERSTSISDYQTVNHIAIGQSGSDTEGFTITFDKDLDSDEWRVKCADTDETLEIEDGAISSDSGSVTDPERADQAIIAIASKTQEIIGATMGDPSGNPVPDPVPGICKQFAS